MPAERREKEPESGGQKGCHVNERIWALRGKALYQAGEDSLVV